VWLPATFLGFTLYFALTRLFVRLVAVGSADITARLALGAAGACAFVAILVLLAAMAVPVARNMVTRDEDSFLAHFVLTRRELGLAVAQLRFYALLFVTVGVVAVLVAGLVDVSLSRYADADVVRGSAATWRGLPILSLAVAASMLGAAAAAILVVARVGFFLIPIGALEDKVTLRRALEISRGTFLRVTATGVILLLPVAMLAVGVLYALYHTQLTQIANDGATQRSLMYLVRFVVDHAPVLAAFAATLLTMVTVLFASASASAYQALALARMPGTEWQGGEISQGSDLPPQKERTRDDALSSSEPSPLQGDLVFAAEERIAALAHADSLQVRDDPQFPLRADPATRENEALAATPNDVVRDAIDTHLALIAAVHPLATFHTAAEASPPEEDASTPHIDGTPEAHSEVIDEALPQPTLAVPEECPASSVHERASEEAWEKMAAAAVQADVDVSTAPDEKTAVAADAKESAVEEFELVEDPLPEERASVASDETLPPEKAAA
jgi:hypothetical protein